MQQRTLREVAVEGDEGLFLKILFSQPRRVVTKRNLARADTNRSVAAVTEQDTKAVNNTRVTRGEVGLSGQSSSPSRGHQVL